MPTEVVLIGAGGFGRETLDVVEAHNAARPEETMTVVGIADDRPSPLNLTRLADRGYRYLGTVADVIDAGRWGRYLLGIGNPSAKVAVDSLLDAAGWRPATVVHPSAVVGSMASVGEGAIICSGAQVSTNVTLGRHVHLNPNATVGHDSALGDHSAVNPGGIVSGEVVVAARTLIGAGAIILQGLAIGSDTTIGAGSVVTKNVPDGVVVKGVPGVWS